MKTRTYNDGKLKVIKEMIAFVEKEIEAVESRKTDPNSEAQITAYAKTTAYKDDDAEEEIIVSVPNEPTNVAALLADCFDGMPEAAAKLKEMNF